MDIGLVPTSEVLGDLLGTEGAVVCTGFQPDDVVLSSSSNQDFECEGLRITSSKLELLVLDRKKEVYSLSGLVESPAPCGGV